MQSDIPYDEISEFRIKRKNFISVLKNNTEDNFSHYNL